MWPFKKRYPSVRDLPDNQWAVATGNNDGRPVLVRHNRACRCIRGHPDYPHQVGVAIPLNDPRADGFPTDAEDVALHAIEEALETRLTANGEAVMTTVITTNGMREFVFYTSNPDATRAKLEQLDCETAAHQVQHVIQYDPQWGIFQEFEF